MEVRLGAGVTDCDCSGVSIGRTRIETRTIIWAAGVKASPAAEWLAVAEHDGAGRVKVQGDLSVPGHPDIFVIGDVAVAAGADGKPLPGVAPVAKQQGQYVASLLIARANGKTCRRSAIAMPARSPRSAASAPSRTSARSRLSGFFAWLLWSVAHIYFLIGFRNRLVVAMNWAWDYSRFSAAPA